MFALGNTPALANKVISMDELTIVTRRSLVLTKLGEVKG
jgi:hypothetical protein